MSELNATAFLYALSAPPSLADALTALVSGADAEGLFNVGTELVTGDHARVHFSCIEPEQATAAGARLAEAVNGVVHLEVVHDDTGDVETTHFLAGRAIEAKAAFEALLAEPTTALTAAARHGLSALAEGKRD